MKIDFTMVMTAPDGTTIQDEKCKFLGEAVAQVLFSAQNSKDLGIDLLRQMSLSYSIMDSVRSGGAKEYELSVEDAQMILKILKTNGHPCVCYHYAKAIGEQV